MAKSDRAGKKISERQSEAFSASKGELELASERESNIVVGDFVSELSAVIRYRQKLGLASGDWLEEPERLFTDGKAFAMEEGVAADGKLQLTLSLDASTSMWGPGNNIMKYAGPTFIELDRVIRKAQRELPEGTLKYAPFIFHEHAFKAPAAYLNNYVGVSKYKKTKNAEEEERIYYSLVPSFESFAAAMAAGELPEGARQNTFRLSGKDTLLAPLFKAIEDWERIAGDPGVLRLDIVLTDGVFENAADVAEATRIQERRNGMLQTVMLNFMPPEDWEKCALPDRCLQFGVTENNLEASIRNVLTEAIQELT